MHLALFLPRPQSNKIEMETTKLRGGKKKKKENFLQIITWKSVDVMYWHSKW